MAKAKLSKLFLQAGFFLLGAYFPGVLTWLIIIEPQVSQKQAPPTPILAGLAVLQSVAVGLGGVVGLVLFAWLQRAEVAFRYPVAVIIVAAIGYLLAISVVP